MGQCLINFIRLSASCDWKDWSFSSVNVEWYFERLLFYFATIYSVFCLFYNQDLSENVSDMKLGKEKVYYDSILSFGSSNVSSTVERDTYLSTENGRILSKILVRVQMLFIFSVTIHNCPCSLKARYQCFDERSHGESSNITLCHFHRKDQWCEVMESCY